MKRTALAVLLWTASLAALAWSLALAWRSFGAGPPADPLEALVLEQAGRFAAGHALCPEPAPGAVPLMPLLPLAAAWLARSIDVGLREIRLVAMLATLAGAGLVGSIVRRETRSATIGMAAAAQLLMSQWAMGAGTSARPEPLMLLLVLVGALALRHSGGIPGALIASVPFSAACFAHPAGLWFALAGLLHLGVHDGRRAVAYGLGLAALVCAAQLELTRRMGPWFNYLAWDAALESLRLDPRALLRLVGTQLLGTLCVFSLALVLSFALPVRPWRGAVGIWTWMALAGLLAGVGATQAGEGQGEAMRTAALVLAIAGPVSAQRVTQHLSTWPGATRASGRAVVLAALALQFVTLSAAAVGAGAG